MNSSFKKPLKASKKPLKDPSEPLKASSEPKVSSGTLNKTSTHAKITVCALYKFTRLDDFESLRTKFIAQLVHLNIRGTLLLAHEGINGTIAGDNTAIESFLTWLVSDERFSGIDYKLSFHDEMPFHRCKVKLKKEIVTIGIDSIDPNNIVGTYVDPQDWNELIQDPDVVLVDTRNEYEYAIGTFANAINPKTDTFREFPNFVKASLDPQQHKKVAMFCTGGIRCEKASALMKEQGFDEVYHLRGGILKYLEEVPEEQSLWQGECFVFDDRVAVDHRLEKGQYEQCHACRHPITQAEMQSIQYVRGVSCPKCYQSLSDEQKQRFAEREKQVQLAKQRGEMHIGLDSRKVAEKNKQQKQTLKELNRKKNAQ